MTIDEIGVGAKKQPFEDEKTVVSAKKQLFEAKKAVVSNEKQSFEGKVNELRMSIHTKGRICCQTWKGQV